ncbi:Imm63 family immunity protein [Streptacidiphilus sp. P02-A3a]|uniref:Imm63 family immunity protein n=1 Tax=Streptacidiphilus sp. P02-A3a TaxID=2704468 RepID=UPI0015F9C7C0|nr:Imm63 family immunity protein [Streptacidiphilus sp. P02-A3a]QMU69862.1 hypothetical protein GXP74_18200 [Streptacidiphilus sp. P02-A3a]
MTISRTAVQAALAQVTANVPDLASRMPKIEGPPFDGVTIEFGSEGEVMLVAHERGMDTVPYSTRNAEELAHQATLRAVWGFALNWEKNNRDRFPEYRDDTRLTRVAKQIEILRRIDPRWAEEFRASVPANYSGLAVDRVDAHPLLSS